MDLEVVGRHALLFDDDSSASFVNSPAALVEWNSLSIDRYDVRHLLSSLPPRFKRRSNTSPPRHPGSPTEAELDYERYLDLPSTSPENEQDLENRDDQVNGGSYSAVPFSYGNAGDLMDQKNADAEPSFLPPFSVPESLLQNLMLGAEKGVLMTKPPTEKVHQIIVRTAMFVSKHGGQSEIVLRVKQGDNPTFGFLMPDHHLHPYFRFVVDHPELLNEENRASGGLDQSNSIEGGGALSLLGSVYGSVEDEDNVTEKAELKKDEKEPVSAVNVTVSNVSEQTESSIPATGKDENNSKRSLPSSKEKAALIKRNQPISIVKARSSGMKKDRDVLGSVSPASDKSQASVLSTLSKIERPVVEPPSDMKRVVDKIVEFILRNGKEFEAVLVEQDQKYGRFPFLLPSNLYYPYYLKVLHKAEESKLPGKGFNSEHDSTGLSADKRNSMSKESDSVSIGSDIPYDSDRKEKFKMVLGRLKKDGQDTPSKSPAEANVSVGVDAAAAAAILQAATRGIRNPNINILSKTSLNGNTESPGIANAIAKSAANAVASEADSSEANMTREQKLKAERLKRAKAFAAMIKDKAAPSKSEPLIRSSAEPPESGLSGSVTVGKEREGSSVPIGYDIIDKAEKSEKKDISEDIERRSKRKYRSRSNKNEEDEGEEEEGQEKEEEQEEKKHKHSRKKHRSSSRKHKKRHSSKDKDYHHRRQHKHDDGSSSDSESQRWRYRHQKDGLSDDDHDDGSRQQHMDSLSADDGRGHSRRQSKKESSLDDYERSRRKRHRRMHDSSSDDEQVHSRYQPNKDGMSDDDKRDRSRHRRRRHKRDSSSDEESHSRYRPKEGTPSDGNDYDRTRHKRDRRKHDSSSENGRGQSHHRHEHDSSMDEEDKHRRRARKHRRRSHSEREGDLGDSSMDEEYKHRRRSRKHRRRSHSERGDLEEGEIKSDASKISESTGAVVSREASVDMSKSHQDVVKSSSSQPPNTSSEVSDDLRAKIRAMLMATL